MNTANTPNQEPRPTQPEYIRPPRYAQVRWVTAGFAILALDAMLLTRTIDGGEFGLIYGILFGFMLLVLLTWLAFTPAVLGLRKKK